MKPFTFPDYVPPTEWEKKEREGLLAQEPAEWREKRLIAEDPDTDGETLARLTSAISDGCAYCIMGEVSYHNKFALLSDTVLAHPNTPPPCLLRLLYLFELNNYRRFCRNPFVPVAALERPDFWQEMGDDRRGDTVPSVRLLLEEDLPRVAVSAFSLYADPFAAVAASFHIAFSGEVKSHEDGLSAVCASGFLHYVEHEFGLKNSDIDALVNRGVSLCWERRLYAALHLPLTGEPFLQIPDYDRIYLKQWNRSPLDLLQYLARDGNRLVRWAAQTRLDDPDFVFSWAN